MNKRFAPDATDLFLKQQEMLLKQAINKLAESFEQNPKEEHMMDIINSNSTLIETLSKDVFETITGATAVVILAAKLNKPYTELDPKDFLNLSRDKVILREFMYSSDRAFMNFLYTVIHNFHRQLSHLEQLDLLKMTQTGLDNIENERRQNKTVDHQQ